MNYCGIFIGLDFMFILSCEIEDFLFIFARFRCMELLVCYFPFASFLTSSNVFVGGCSHDFQIKLAIPCVTTMTDNAPTLLELIPLFYHE